ncbi:MAG TPA: SDR family oxidoreductase [Gemmatimonadales bacterium]|jgi:pteridine reductase|nr:SDR family oxidoreductase [Gemmatimonadales bacterium]
MQLAGAAALVTGAGRRLGQAIAVGLARAGCDIAVHYHGSTTGAAGTAREVGAAGRRAELLAADLSDATAAQGLADRAATALGRLDIVVNSAAIMVRQPIETVTPESWDDTMDLNVRAAFFVSQGALPHLRRAKGKIVNLADVAGFEPWPAYIPHCVSKAGMVMLTKALARAVAPDVTVNAVAPGPVLLPDEWDAATRDHIRDTTPLQRLGKPEDVVSAVRFLLESDFVTGTILVVDGGRLIR